MGRLRWLTGMLATIGIVMACALPAGATITTKKSNYWAGYVAVGSYRNSFRFVSTTFTVPTPDCTTTPNGETWHFAALGGWGGKSNYIEGAGVVEGCNSGTAYASGAIWIGAFPNAGGYGRVLTGINPGDTVTASVFFNKTTGEPNFKVADITQGTFYQQYRACNPAGCGLSSAEVVSDGNGGTFSQGNSDFGAVTFNKGEVTRYGSAYKTTDFVNSAWITQRLVEIGSVSGQVEISPGGLSNTVNNTPNYSTFTDTWIRQS